MHLDTNAVSRKTSCEVLCSPECESPSTSQHCNEFSCFFQIDACMLGCVLLISAVVLFLVLSSTATRSMHAGLCCYLGDSCQVGNLSSGALLGAV